MKSLHELNQELKLYGSYAEIGSHLPFWLPNGALIRTSIEEFWRREHIRLGYQIVFTPHIARSEVWRESGHLERFSGRMFPPLKGEAVGEEYFLRPMNCPFHIRLYATERRSYRELPIRYAELGTVYRYIGSGSTKEMLEVRGFTQDDAHIFCERHRVNEELASVLQLFSFFIRDVFGIDDYRVVLRLKPLGAMGEDALWSSAQQALREVLKEKDIAYEEEPGEGLFYGPKIDFEILEPTSKKSWVCSTVQLDIVLAETAGLRYTSELGREETPLIIHRTVLGSLERFIGILTTRTQGHLPAWIAPIQVAIIPVGGSEFVSNLSYAREVSTFLQRSVGGGLRIQILDRDLDLRESKKEGVRTAAPYIVVVGGRERLAESASVLKWEGQQYSDEAISMSLAKFMEEVKGAIRVGSQL